MSVILLSADELGLFTAIATHRQLLPFREALAVAELISVSNCAAYNEQYNEIERALTVDEIEEAALDRLAKKEFTSESFPPLLYNCMTNSGSFYFGELEIVPGMESSQQLEEIKSLCDSVEAWHSAERRRIARQAEDDEAFVEVGPLPKLSGDEIRAKMAEAKAARIITAEFRVNESDLQSDYHGGRSGRLVVIGFGTGKRESFKQLRTAAGDFPPTASFGPGLDVWHVRQYREEKTELNRYPNSTRLPEQFSTEEQAAAWAEAAIARDKQKQLAGDCFCPEMPFGYELEFSSIEHRENYSMGGGNYLGLHRYSGWIVRSSTCVPASVEFFEAPRKTTVRKTSPKPPQNSQPELRLTTADQYSANV
jgi:hypothetical protein